MRLIGCLAMLALVTSPLAAQDGRLASRLDPATAAEVSGIVATARNAGLPTEPLVDRALEGASKGAAPARIVAAVRTLARDLTTARQALGQTSTESELTAAAGALRAGARADLLGQLRQARRSDPVTVPLGVLADLVARGVPSDSASQAVLLMAQGGASDNDFVNLRRNVERDIRNGAPPAIAATVRARGRPSTLPPPVFGPPPAVMSGPDRERATQAGTPRP